MTCNLRGDFDVTTKASAFMFWGERDTWRCALMRDTATLPMSFQGPGCAGGGTVALPDGASARAAIPIASTLSTIGECSRVSIFQDMIYESRLGSAAAGAEQTKGESR